MSADAFSGLVSSVQYMNQQKARHRAALEDANKLAGERLLFATLVEALPEGNPLKNTAVIEEICRLGRVAHSEGRAPAPVDPGMIFSELLGRHHRAVQRAAEELEDQQPTQHGLVFRHFELRVRRDPMRLKVSTLEEAQAVRLRAAQLVRETKFNESVDAPRAVRKAMGER